jgi:hypothetical protein
MHEKGRQVGQVGQDDAPEAHLESASGTEALRRFPQQVLFTR